MTQRYYDARDKAQRGLVNLAEAASETNHLGGLLMHQASQQFGGLFGAIERELWEDCSRCHWPLPPSGDCENKKCEQLPAPEKPSVLLAN